MKPTTVFQIDRLLTMHTLFYWALLHLSSYEHYCRCHCITIYTTTVIVSYFNMLEVIWCVILPDDGGVLTKACRRDRSCTVTYNVCAYVGFVNKTYTYCME